MKPLTNYHPKPMLQVLGKPILEHILESLPPHVDEVIFVVGYMGDQIRAYFGEKFGRFKVRYVTQEEKLGTYHALLLCKQYLEGERFLFLYGDDLHGRGGIAVCALNQDPTVLVAEVSNPEIFGTVIMDKNGYVEEIEEKPEHPKTNLIMTGVMVLDDRIFSFEPPLSPKGEYYLSHAVGAMAKQYKVKAMRGTAWRPIGYPEDLEKAADFLKRNEHLK